MSTPSKAQYDVVVEPKMGIELHIIDTPGYLATQNRTGNDKEDMAKDGNLVLKEFAKALMYARDGIDAICITLRAADRMSKEEELLMQFIEELHLWKHCFLLFTHGYRVGHNEDDRYSGFYDTIKQEGFEKQCPVLAKMLDLTKKRFVIIESVQQAGNEKYYHSKVKEICGAIDVVRKDVGAVINHPLLELARNAWEVHQKQVKLEEDLKKGEREKEKLKEDLSSKNNELERVKIDTQQRAERTKQLTDRLREHNHLPPNNERSEAPSLVEDPVSTLVSYLEGVDITPDRVIDAFSQLTDMVEKQRRLNTEILREVSQAGSLGLIKKKTLEATLKSLMQGSNDESVLSTGSVERRADEGDTVNVQEPPANAEGGKRRGCNIL